MLNFKGEFENWVRGSLWKKFSWINILLLPFSFFYLIGHFINYNVLNKPQKIKKPVICVGNLVVGGAGKTPIAIELAKMCKSMGIKAAFVGHGYKAKIEEVNDYIQVDPNFHSSIEVGDEALLLADVAPTYISSKRIAAAKAASESGADIIILDDGLQDNSIFKDFSIIVVNSEYMLGNRMLIPSGPLRDLLCRLSSADSVIVVGQDHSSILKSIKNLLDKHHHLEKEKIVSAQMQLLNAEQLLESQYVLLLGVSDPEKILKTIRANQIFPLKTFLFPDHHNFTEKELSAIYKEAEDLHCKILTTSKDYKRIPAKYHKKTSIIEVDVILGEIDKLHNFLRKNF